MKKIKFSLWTIGVLGVCCSIVPVFLTSCTSAKTETQYMCDLFTANQDVNKKSRVNNKESYFAKWKEIYNRTGRVNNRQEINWAIEYTLYIPILYKEFTIIGGGTPIKLIGDSTLYSYIANGDVTPTFLSDSANTSITYIDGDSTFHISYTGYLQLNLNKQITFYGGYVLNKGDAIQLIYAFTDATFSEDNINEPTYGNYYSNDFSLGATGTSLGIAEVFKNGHTMFSEIEPPSSPDQYPNYFNATVGN